MFTFASACTTSPRSRAVNTLFRFAFLANAALLFDAWPVKSPGTATLSLAPMRRWHQKAQQPLPRLTRVSLAPVPMMHVKGWRLPVMHVDAATNGQGGVRSATATDRAGVPAGQGIPQGVPRLVGSIGEAHGKVAAL